MSKRAAGAVLLLQLLSLQYHTLPGGVHNPDFSEQSSCGLSSSPVAFLAAVAVSDHSKDSLHHQQHPFFF